MADRKVEMRRVRSEGVRRDIYEIAIDRPHTRYLDWFWTRDSLTLHHSLRIFPDMKEISESVAAYFAASAKLHLHVTDAATLAFCVGDGMRPRTGALLALNTKWRVASIDPSMATDAERVNNIVKNVDRLTVMICKIEEAQIDPALFAGMSKVVLLQVHSHARLSASVAAIRRSGWRGAIHIVSIPCCVAEDLTEAPVRCYQDAGVLSPENQVNLYRLAAMEG